MSGQDNPASQESFEPYKVCFVCPRFVPAQVLRKKIETTFPDCQTLTANTIEESINQVGESFAMIVYHAFQLSDVADLAKAVASLHEPLIGGLTSLVVISRLRVLQLRTLLARYPSAQVFPTAVSLGDLEKHIIDRVRRNLEGASLASLGTQVGGSSGGVSGQDLSLTYKKPGTNTTLVFKGKSFLSKPVVISSGGGSTSDKAEIGASEPIGRDGSYEIGASDRSQREGGHELGSDEASGPDGPFELFSDATDSLPEDVKEKLLLDRVNSATEKLFRPITSPEKKRKLLRDCIESEAAVQLVLPDKDVKLPGLFCSLDDSSQKVTCKLIDLNSIHADQNKDLALSPLAIFSVALRQSRLFMSTNKIYRENSSNPLIEFEMPRQLYVVQRRKGFRAMLFPETHLPVHLIKKPSLKSSAEFPIYDLSVGGIAVILRKDFMKLFKAGDFVDDVSFTLSATQIRVPQAKVCHITPFRVGPHVLFHRMGLQFTELDKKYAEVVGAYVDKYSQNYFSHYFAMRK